MLFFGCVLVWLYLMAYQPLKVIQYQILFMHINNLQARRINLAVTVVVLAKKKKKKKKKKKLFLVAF